MCKFFNSTFNLPSENDCFPGMPSDIYDTLTLDISGTEYTAPANGWFCINYNMTSNTSYAGLNIDGYAFVMNGTTLYNAPFMFPCKKGNKIKINYSAAIVSLFRFYYAQGQTSLIKY